MVFLPHLGSKSNRDSRFDHHDSVRIALDHQLDHILHRTGVKKILFTVIVGRSCNDNKSCLFIGSFRIQRGRKAQILMGQIFFYIVVLDGRFSLVDQLYLLRHNIHRHDLIMLRQKRGNRQSHISCSCYCYLHFSFLPS